MKAINIKRNKAILFLIVISVFGIGNKSYAQKDILTTLQYSDTVSFNFTSEWQYLSTDIYLFNGSKFTRLINELGAFKLEPKRTIRIRKGLRKERLEFLLITAQLKNVKFFSDKNITYPLYNFQVNQSDDEAYRTFVSDNIDKVRIIDNLPLYSANDYIDAEIRVRAITNNNKDLMLSMVASQLKNISEIANPTGAVLSLIGEFGNFVESSTARKEYRFSSTIRLYEQNNFDTRLHSLKIYSLNTTRSDSIQLPVSHLQNFLDTCTNPVIDRELITELLPYTDYPFLVVANYKSLYKMDDITGDEITFANIEKRKLDIANSFKAGFINEETYKLERDFTNFLTVFANLKNHLEMYSLNFKTGNTNAFANGLFSILQYYKQLLKTFDEAKFKYKDNQTFDRIFKREYEKIIGYAQLYLDNDHNLKSGKQMVETSLSLENTSEIDSAKAEQYLKVLNFANVFSEDKLKNTTEGQIIANQVKNIEKDLYTNYFDQQVRRTEQLLPTLANKELLDEMLNKLQQTNCTSCRDSLSKANKMFQAKYRELMIEQELDKFERIKTQLQTDIFAYYDTLKTIDFSLHNGIEDTTEYGFDIIQSKISVVKTNIEVLSQYARFTPETRNLESLMELNTKIQNIIKQTTLEIAFLKANTPKLLQKISVSQHQLDSIRLYQQIKDFEMKRIKLLDSLRQFQPTLDSLLKSEQSVLDSCKADTVASCGDIEKTIQIIQAHKQAIKSYQAIELEENAEMLEQHNYELSKLIAILEEFIKSKKPAN